MQEGKIGLSFRNPMENWDYLGFLVYVALGWEWSKGVARSFRRLQLIPPDFSTDNGSLLMLLSLL